MTKILAGLLLCSSCYATESLDSTPVNYTEIRLRTIFCDATFAATVSDSELHEAAHWATHYGVVCGKVKEREAREPVKPPKPKDS